MAEGKISRFEPAHITQHFGLAIVRVEDRVGEKIGCAICDLRLAICRGRSRKYDSVFAEDVEEDLDVVRRGRFVERNSDAVGPEDPQVAVSLQSPAKEFSAAAVPQIHPDRVEKFLVAEVVTELLEALGQAAGEVMHTKGNSPQSFWSMI